MFYVEKLVSDPIVMFLDNKICLNQFYSFHIILNSYLSYGLVVLNNGNSK